MTAVYRAIAVWLALLHVLHSARCSVPDDLSNHVNEYVCDNRVRLVRPRTVKDVRKAVKRHDRIVAVGAGHSYDKEFFCADAAFEDGETAANIVMTSIRRPKIGVNEKEMSVWVSAGVMVWDVMAFLGDYVTDASPRGDFSLRAFLGERETLPGYALAKVAFWVNQTIGGAVATDTHGSSLISGSLSDQTIGVRVVLANGTLTEIYPDRHPLYFKAFQVNVGRLGVVTDVKLRIIRETLVKRTLTQYTGREDFLSEMREIQAAYASGDAIPEWIASVMYYISFSEDVTFSRYTFQNLGVEVRDGAKTRNSWSLERVQATPLGVHEDLSSSTNCFFRRFCSKAADGVEWTVPDPLPPNSNLSDPDVIAEVTEAFPVALSTFLGNATGDTHEVEVVNPANAPTEPGAVDLYEVVVPLDKAEKCLDSFIDLAIDLSAETFLRDSLLIRFSPKGSGLLSASIDGAAVWFNLNDYGYYNREPRSSNVPFKRLIAHLVADESCSPSRLHLGKAGFPDFGCWNGAEHYKDTWCDFGCAVRALDPKDKFVGSAPDRWNWNGANLEKCCTDEGYDTSLDGCGCDVIPIRTPEECPEAPYYTNR